MCVEISIFQESKKQICKFNKFFFSTLYDSLIIFLCHKHSRRWYPSSSLNWIALWDFLFCRTENKFISWSSTDNNDNHSWFLWIFFVCHFIAISKQGKKTKSNPFQFNSNRQFFFLFIFVVSTTTTTTIHHDDMTLDSLDLNMKKKVSSHYRIYFYTQS